MPPLLFDWSDAVDPACPLNGAHPLNAGRVFHGYGVSNSGWTGGNTLRDITRGLRTANDGALTGSPDWTPTPYGMGLTTTIPTSGVTATFPDVGSVGGVTYGTSWWLAFWFKAVSYGGGFVPILDDPTRNFSAFYDTGGSPSFGFSGWGVLTAGRWYRLARTQTNNGVSASGRVYVDGQYVGTGGTPLFWVGSFPLSFGLNPSGGGSPGAAAYADITFGTGVLPWDDGMVAHDYEQSRRNYPDGILNRIGRRAWTLVATSSTYTATSALTAGAATTALSATFVKPTYTGTSAASIAHATTVGTATFVKPTYTGTSSLTTGHATGTGAATFVKPTYTGASALSTAPITSLGSATFVKPTYTGTSALLARGASSSITATFAKPTYSGTSGCTVGVTTSTGTAIFYASLVLATSQLVVGAATFEGLATFTFVAPDASPIHHSRVNFVTRASSLNWTKQSMRLNWTERV